MVEKGYFVSFWVRKFALGHLLFLRLASFSDVSSVQTIFHCTCALWLRAYLPVACMRDTACYDADLIIDRQRQVSQCGTTHMQQAGDGLRLARVVGPMSLKVTSHAFFTTASLRNMGLGSRADIATLGLAISLATSASVSLSSCFLVFFVIRHDATSANRLQFNSDHVWPLGSLFVKLRDCWETVPWHEDWCGLKTAHLWRGDARRATGSFPTLPPRLLMSRPEK
jgi:hypothetical protein